MIPVTQDIFGEEGNCLASCVASIFELPLREVPNFVAKGGDGSWFGRLWDFVRARGYEVVPYHIPNQPTLQKCEMNETLHALELKFDNLPEHLKALTLHPYHILSGPAARGFHHACIGWNGNNIHDPHPSRAGLIRVESYYFLSKIKQEGQS